MSRTRICPTAEGLRLILGFALAAFAMALSVPLLAQTSFVAVGGGTSSGGTVASVDVAVPAYMGSSGGPITNTGTITLTFVPQAQGLIFASPCSGSGVVTWRSLCGPDIPNIAESQVTSLTADLAAKLAKASNLSDLTSASTARTNLGLGSLATQNGSFSGTSSGTNTGDQVVPVNTTATAFNFFTAYNALTGAFTKAQPAFTDISGSIAPSQLPNPTSSTLGGVQSFAAQTNKFVNAISTSGVPSAAQVDTGNLSTTTALSGNMNVGMNALAIEIANEGATGTTTNKIVKLSGAPSTAIITATSDTSGALGICVANCGTTGNAVVARAGQASCVFDGATTAGNYVQLSATVAGDCHDTGLSTWPTSGGQVLGRVLSTNGAGGTYLTTLHIGTQAIPAAATVGGSDTQVQFNDASSFGGDSQFTFNKTSGLTTITGASNDGSALAKFLPGSGTSSTQINNNGTVVIDGDGSTGSTMLNIKSAGASRFTFGASGQLVLAGLQASVQVGAVTALTINGRVETKGFGLVQTAVKTSAYTTGAADSIVRLDPSGGAFTVTLSSANAAATIITGAHQVILLKNVTSSVNTVTVTPSSGTIDGASSTTMSVAYGSLRVFFDGANWFTLGGQGRLTVAGGVTSSTGFQHVRVASCTTGSLINASCDTTVTWPVAFADTSYTSVATLDSPSGGLVFILSTKNKTTTSIDVTLVTLTAAASSGTINLIGVHD